MPSLDRDACRGRLVDADHGVLATVDTAGRPHQVPVCYVVLGQHVVIPVDDVKPKRSTRLRRADNLEHHPLASLLVEGWDRDDWSALWWVRADCRWSPADGPPDAAATEELRSKYAQYRDATFTGLLVLRVEHLQGWAAMSS